MRLAKGEFDLAALGGRPVTGVAIDLEDGIEPGQMRARPHCLATDRKDTGDAGRIGAAPWQVVPRIVP